MPFENHWKIKVFKGCTRKQKKTLKKIKKLVDFVYNL